MPNTGPETSPSQRKKAPAMRLTAVRIFVEDLATARRFYAETLGLTMQFDGSVHGYCVFKAGAADLVIESVAADAPDEDRALVGRFSGLSFSVPDAEATYRQLAAQGVTFTGLPELQTWGGTLATLMDPSGNALQIVQYPAAP
jgi:predicted enzyme related to lactoylglutathione lyase